jgi:class 3 adenylate cyclase
MTAEGVATILFTDIVGSTDVAKRQGDERAQVLRRIHDEVVLEQVNEHGGRHVKSLGDGAMLAFSSPRKALACAAAIQRALGKRTSGRRAEPFAVRIGINAGEVIDEDGDVFGETVNAAARIAAKAGGGQILVSEVVKQLAGTVPDLSLRDRGRFRLKGFPDRCRLFEVAWRQVAAPEPALLAEGVAMVGRDRERDQLVGALERAVAGNGGLWMIGGEPGVGKTRLGQEMVAEATKRGMLAFVGRCYESAGAPPYAPFVEVIDAAVAEAETAETFRALLGEDAPEVARIVPRLRRLYPDIPQPVQMPPEQERLYIFNSVREFLAQ